MYRDYAFYSKGNQVNVYRLSFLQVHFIRDAIRLRMGAGEVYDGLTGSMRPLVYSDIINIAPVEGGVYIALPKGLFPTAGELERANSAKDYIMTNDGSSMAFGSEDELKTVPLTFVYTTGDVETFQVSTVEYNNIHGFIRLGASSLTFVDLSADTMVTVPLSQVRKISTPFSDVPDYTSEPSGPLLEGE